MIYFLKCEYCGRHPDTPHSTCRGCGAPLEAVPPPKFVRGDPGQFNRARGGIEPKRQIQGYIDRVTHSMVTIGDVNIKATQVSKDFDAKIRRWIGD